MKREITGTANRTHRYTFRLTDEENHNFLSLMAKSGSHTITKFILGQIFNREFRVVTTDIEKHKYYAKLSDYYRQFRGLANNYNQVTKRIHSVFDDRTARYMLRELRDVSTQIADLMSKILANAEEFRERWGS